MGKSHRLPVGPSSCNDDSADGDPDESGGGVINGDRRGLNWGAGGAWADGTGGVFPDWLEVAFNGSKTIDQVDVFAMQDTYTSPSEPTRSMTFSLYGRLYRAVLERDPMAHGAGLCRAGP